MMRAMVGAGLRYFLLIIVVPVHMTSMYQLRDRCKLVFFCAGTIEGMEL